MQKGLVAAPDDREPAVRTLIEGVGGNLLNFYFIAGDSNFIIISEGDEAESLIGALMTTEAAGTISNTITARAWTGGEFKALVDKAAKATSAYRAPGKS